MPRYTLFALAVATLAAPAACGYGPAVEVDRSISPAGLSADPVRYAGKSVQFSCRVVRLDAPFVDARCSDRNDPTESPVLLRGAKLAQLTAQDVVITGVAAVGESTSAFGKRLVPIVEVRRTERLDAQLPD